MFRVHMDIRHINTANNYNIYKSYDFIITESNNVQHTNLSNNVQHTNLSNNI